MEILARAIGWLVIEIILEVVCYGLGKGFLRVITLGKYPKPETSDNYIQAVGACILISPLIFYTVYVYKYH